MMDAKSGFSADATVSKAADALAIDWESIKSELQSTLSATITESVSNITDLEPHIRAIAEDLTRYAARGDSDTLDAAMDQARALGLIIASREAHTFTVGLETLVASVSRVLIGVLGSVAGLRPA